MANRIASQWNRTCRFGEPLGLFCQDVHNLYNDTHSFEYLDANFSYLALTPPLDEAGFLADLDGSLTPNAPLLINLLLFK